MKTKITKSIASITLSIALLTTAVSPVWASDGLVSAAAAVTSYKLTDFIDVEIKSILNEQTGDGTQIGAVIRMKNTSAKITRVPDYEIRVRTTDGVEYALQSSSRNAASIKPKAQVEMSYLTLIEQANDIGLESINWVDVDMYVYPKKETEVLTIPFDAVLAWKGSDTVITDQTALKKWGESFIIPQIRSLVEYRAVNIHKESTPNGPQTVVQIEAANSTSERQSVPVFSIDGIADNKVYNGTRVEDKVTLEPGEKKYLHFIIPTELDTELRGLHIVTPEKFATAVEEKTYYIGRLKVLIPNSALAGAEALRSYELGTLMKLDPLNKRIHSSMEVSLVELTLQENEGDGFKTAIAKYKLTNLSDRPLPVPVFQTTLASKDGYEYTGSRQAATALQVVPNASYVVSYSFALPSSEDGEDLKLSLYEQQAAGSNSFKSLLASYQVDVQPASDAKKFKVYPYHIEITDWSFSANFSAMTGVYSYGLKLFLKLDQDKQVITDTNSSKLQFDTFDSSGKLIGSEIRGLTGQNRLLNGDNLITTNAFSDQLAYPITMKIYEVMVNENGEMAKRFLTSIKN